MRLKADRVEAKKETVVAENTNSMKEGIETKAEAELIVLCTSDNVTSFLQAKIVTLSNCHINQHY